MTEQKRLTSSGMSIPHLIFIFNSIAMLAVTLYLTTHYYETIFPTQINNESSLCNFSSFFNCDSATYSSAASLFGIPTSFFGLILSILFLTSSLLQSDAMERTASSLAKFNFIGCVILFTYSLVVLKSLCPFCTMYYVLSGLAYFLFKKYGANSWKPELKSLALWGLVLIIGSFSIRSYTQTKQTQQQTLGSSVVDQFTRLAVIGEPDKESPFKIYQSTANFQDAPIRMTIFSDFECPFCKTVSEQLSIYTRKYAGKINIQYAFFPLDSECNSNLQKRFHEHACRAAYAAVCSKNNFAQAHDEIFALQEKLSQGALDEFIKKNNLQSCVADPNTKNQVVEIINLATKFNIRSTPTLIINGRKIEGLLPSSQMFAIFDSLLRK